MGSKKPLKHRGKEEAEEEMFSEFGILVSMLPTPFNFFSSYFSILRCKGFCFFTQSYVRAEC